MTGFEIYNFATGCAALAVSLWVSHDLDAAPELHWPLRRVSWFLAPAAGFMAVGAWQFGWPLASAAWAATAVVAVWLWWRLRPPRPPRRRRVLAVAGAR